MNTLSRYLSTGDSIMSIALAYRIGLSTAKSIIHETTDVIWDVLKNTYLKPPTLEDYSDIADKFMRIWQLPNCTGGIDWKHASEVFSEHWIIIF